MWENYNSFQSLTIIISVGAMIISAVSAVIAVIYSRHSIKIGKDSNRLHELSYYQKLMSEIISIREGFHSEILQIRIKFPLSTESALDKCSEEEKKSLNDYWEIVFREYRICKGTKIRITAIEELWDNEFRIEVFRSLRWRSFRESLEEQIRHKQKNPLHREAIKEFQTIMSESLNHYQ